ncbi:phage tail protein [Yersinia enterocolitica]
MTARFFALLTNIGAAKLTNATALGTRLEITQMAVGDGGGTLPTPNPAQTQLVNEQRRAALNTLSVDPINTSQIIAEQVIPEAEGGWWIREIGLLDKDGDLIAIANCAETYKPLMQEGSGRTQTIRVVLIVSSTAVVTLKIDPSVVLATRQYVDKKTDDKAIEVKQYADALLAEHEKSRNHPDATLNAKGFAQYSNAMDSDSEKQAATSKAVNMVAKAGVMAMSDHVQTDNPHDQYLQIANLLSEIKAQGPAALAETLENLGLGDISAKLPKFIILYPDGTESAPAIMTKNIRKAIANPFPSRRVEALVEVLIAGQWGATGWLYNPNVAGFGSGISAYPYGSNSSDDFIIIQSGGLEVTTSSSSAGNPHGISAQVTSAPYRIRIKTVN